MSHLQHMRLCVLHMSIMETVCCSVVHVQVTLAFINAKRPKECGACGSLLDAVCLLKV